jgi:hypothetical protein
MKASPSYLELNIDCQEGERQIFYSLYVELTEWDRQQLQGGSPGQVKLMTARMKLLDVLLRRNVVPIEEPVSGRVIDHDIDAWLKDAEPAETEDRHKVWIVRVG